MNPNLLPAYMEQPQDEFEKFSDTREHLLAALLTIHGHYDNDSQDIREKIDGTLRRIEGIRRRLNLEDKTHVS